jgi:Sec-independent protein translocase protein TatA
MDLFGVGLGEAGLVLVITLIVVGPKRFPAIAREGGKWYRTARRYADEVMRDVRGAMNDLEREVEAQGEDLRSIREIGRDLGEDINRIGTETREVAAREPTPLDPSGRERPESDR